MWLITGSRGYVGRHLTLLLRSKGIEYVGIDYQALGSLDLTHGTNSKELEGDYSDKLVVARTLVDYPIRGIIHLAALKDVSQAIQYPDRYLSENLETSISFLKVVSEFKVQKFIFASSAAVYGDKNTLSGFDETDETSASNAYGESKLRFEMILKEWQEQHGTTVFSLRFFNISGANRVLKPDLEGSNLIPLILRSARNSTTLNIFGSNFPTKDGTAQRDYVHVEDVAEAIFLSSKIQGPCFEILNIGTGFGTTVLEVVKSLNMSFNLDLLLKIQDPRPGDSYSSIAKNLKAKQLLGWVPKRNFIEIIESYRTSHI
jgi:UDP-glucose 4-epimerase